VKAKLVSENINFQRGRNPLGSMDLGGFSFDTLRPGAILKTKRYFGVSKSTGTIGGYNSSAIRISKDQYLLVTEVRDQGGGKKNISWRKYHDLERAMDEREILKWAQTSMAWYGITKGFFDQLTKRRFDYRMEIVEPGFPVTESTVFQRGQDPKRAMRIGEKTWDKLRPGDFLRPKKEIRAANGAFKPPSYKGGKTFYPEDYVVVITYRKGVVEYNRHITMGYSMHLRRCWDQKEAMDIRSMIEDGTYTIPREHDAFNRPVQGSYQQWETRFDIDPN
jgi:hypothetical protein